MLITRFNLSSTFAALAVFTLLLGFLSRASATPKAEWAAAQQTNLVPYLCGSGTALRTNGALSEAKCEKEITKITAACLKKIDKDIPKDVDAVNDGKLGSQLNECTNKGADGLLK